jgi:hypothetical protein
MANTTGFNPPVCDSYRVSKLVNSAKMIRKIASNRPRMTHDTQIGNLRHVV